MMTERSLNASLSSEVTFVVARSLVSMYFATSSLITTLITADYYARLRRRAQLRIDVLRDELRRLVLPHVDEMLKRLL